MLNVVVLAAGKGTRMRSMRPKVLHFLAGKTLLDHVLQRARRVNADNLCVVIGHGADAVRQSIQDETVQFIEQSPQLGTGHALQLAAPLLHDEAHTLIMYGDVPLTRVETLEKLLQQVQIHSLHQPHQACLGLLTVNLSTPDGYGRIVRDDTGRVERIVEQKDATPSEHIITEVNTGIMVVPTRELKQWLGQLSNQNAQGEYYLTDVIAMAVADGISIVTAQPADKWETMGVNSREQLAQLERVYQREVAVELMTQGVGLADPARLDVRGELICDTDVMIDVNCVFEGSVSLGSNVSIGANCVIRNATIAAGTQVAPFSHIDGAVVGADAKIGPFARLRPDAMIGDHAHIGNFVEIKKSTIAEGSKVNHLAYVGDAVVGKAVNIGAGVITCNYDGVNKHQTIIGDGAFIGSNCQLVAPVTIGAGATIGAGSTITREAPVNELTLSRSKQVTITGWKRPVKQK